jgi:hypothetical protein
VDFATGSSQKFSQEVIRILTRHKDCFELAQVVVKDVKRVIKAFLDSETYA